MENRARNQTHRGPGIKQWRLIVRNLPFDTTESDIVAWAEKYGRILETVLPKCRDKRFPNSCAGYCFIQFSRNKDAEKAQESLNFADFKGRKVSVDWAVDKDTFVTKMQEAKLANKKLKEEVDEEKLEKGGDDDGANSNAESEVEEEEGEGESEEESEPEEEDEQHPIKKEPDSDEDPLESRETNKSSMGKLDKANARSKEDGAVKEGRVVFVRNVAFDANSEQMKETAAHFGKVQFAILCRNKETEQPTGTGFIHFCDRASADAFLAQLLTEEGIFFGGRKLFGHRAVQRNEALAFARSGKKVVKDKRNLYLLRASLIRPGTAQSRGMSDQDAKLRERLMEAARTKLKNLVMFVSPTRLAIHNVPFSFTDAQLESACLTAAGQEPSAITECRIMHERRGDDAKGRRQFGKSKGFAFVSFVDHNAALSCLHKMNNNPSVFSNERRPIVEFSIEDLKALRAKERRQKLVLQGDELKGRSKLEEAEDSAAVERTKRAMMAGGRKWLPKKLGAKVRHQGSEKKARRIAKPSAGEGARKIEGRKRKRSSSLAEDKIARME